MDNLLNIINAVIPLIAAITAFMVPVSVFATAIGVIMLALNAKAQREVSERNTALLNIVKTQNDGVLSRLEAKETESRNEAKAATAEAHAAKVEVIESKAVIEKLVNGGKKP